MKSYISSIMIHLDLQHHLYLREEGFYKDSVIRAYGGTAKSAVS